MNTELRRYPAYKNSGVPWLEDVPEHWDVKRGKNFFRCIDVRSETGDEELLTVSSERGVVPRRTASVTMFKAESYAGYKLCWPNDLVINSLWAWARGLGVSRYHGIVSSAYGVYRVRPEANVLPQFIHELVRSSPFNWELRVRSKGIWTSRLQLTDESFLDAPFPLPPLSEQTAIVRFLDHVERRIRRYIVAKQKLIKLLEEQKQVIIHRVVTRGLDPNVRIKFSGVDWLGDVPEHWEIGRVKQCAKTISKGTTPSTEGREMLDQGPVRYLKAENISGGRIIERPLTFIDETTNDVLRRSQLKNGDVLFVIAGATLGKTAVIDREILPANTNQAVAFVRSNHRISPQYLSLWLQSYRIRELTWLNAVQSAQPNLSMEDLGNFPIVIPPRSEQLEIIRWLEDLLISPDSALTDAHSEISLLREYRTRLVSDVVTGKLDVREAAARLPDEVEALEPLEETEADGNADADAADEIDAVTEEAEV